MAYVEKITVRVELLQNLGDGTSVKPCYELVAQLEEGDDETVVTEELEKTLMERVTRLIDHELQQRDQHPIYFKADSFIADVEMWHIDSYVYIKGTKADFDEFSRWLSGIKNDRHNVVGEVLFFVDNYADEKWEKLHKRYVLISQDSIDKNSPAMYRWYFADLSTLEGWEILETLASVGHDKKPFEYKNKHRFEFLPFMNPAPPPADVDNGYEEMEAVQQHSDPDFFNNEIEQLEDPDDPNDPFYFPGPERDPNDPQWHSDSADDTIF